MKRICIVGAMNVKHMSLISLYTHVLDGNGVPYDLIYMDRYGIEEKTTAANKYCLRVTMDRHWHKLKKLMVYLRFRRFARGILSRENYDVVITWQTFTAYLLADILMRKYKGRFVINVRDYIAENIPPVTWLLGRLVRRSAFTAISSGGFLAFLPKGAYVKVNSINPDILQAQGAERSSKHMDVVTIGFVGNCRFFDENKKLINALQNDPRFELWYCGTNSDIYKRYAEENGVANLKTMPAFEPSETTQIMTRFDMINSVFGSGSVDNRTLLPIRLYTAIAYGLPVLASAQTQTAKEITGHHLGFVIESYENVGDALYAYMRALDKEQFKENCAAYLQNALRENMDFTRRFKTLIGCDAE